jgi:hypothetical protein
MSDFDIIADIIANATAAASSKSGTYSSLSSGKASIAGDQQLNTSNSTGTSSPRKSGFFSSSSGRSKSETIQRTGSRSSLFGTSLFSRKRIESEEEKELRDAGVTVKEIKGTLGRLVVPNDIANPMPKVKLEAPQHARLNR